MTRCSETASGATEELLDQGVLPLRSGNPAAGQQQQQQHTVAGAMRHRRQGTADVTVDALLSSVQFVS
ncbi:MAG: hypothetical protein WDW38_010486 [Sanguina aurantia]